MQIKIFLSLSLSFCIPQFRGSFVSTIQIAERHSGIEEERVSRLIRRGARHDFMGEVVTEWRGILSRKNRGRLGE